MSEANPSYRLRRQIDASVRWQRRPRRPTEVLGGGGRVLLARSGDVGDARPRSQAGTTVLTAKLRLTKKASSSPQ